MINSKRKLITTKTVSIATLAVAVTTVLSIWLFGLGQHRTIFENSILSMTTLSALCFTSLTIGLYYGVKLKDDIGKLTDKAKPVNFPDLSSGFEIPPEAPVMGEGIAEIIAGIIAWIAFSVLLLVALWLFGAILWVLIVVFAAMLYWIFFRALRLVFKNSHTCKDNLPLSLAYGLGYTVLYSFWVYGIVLASHYLV